MDWAKNVPCKNVSTYGFCKYEDKGCAFSHAHPSLDKPKESPEKPSVKFKPESAQFRPSSASFKPDSAPFRPDSAPFKPESAPFKPDSAPFKPDAFKTASFNAFRDAAPFVPLPPPDAHEELMEKTAYSYGSTYPDSSAAAVGVAAATPPQQGAPPQLTQPQAQLQSHLQFTTLTYGAPQDMYFAPQQQYPLQHHLYAPNTLNMRRARLAPHERNAHTLFLANSLRERFLKRNEAILQTIPHLALPEYVSVYHTLVPLDRTLKKSTKSYGVPSSLYKVFSNRDGNPYVLRRLEGFQGVNEKSLVSVAKWRTALSKNALIAGVYEAFTSLAFGDSLLFFVHEYYPLSKTLKETHTKPGSVPEALLWDYVVQLVNGIGYAHTKGLAVRTLTVEHVLVTGERRVVIGGCSIADVISYASDAQKMAEKNINRKEYMALLQKQDWKDLGEVIASLMAVNNGVSVDSITQNLDQITHYSPEIVLLTRHLLEQDTDNASVQALITPHVFGTMNGVLCAADAMEGTLANEIENDRLVRLLTKICFVLDRPGESWAETGDRYPIKLLMDYIFHQVDQDGKPVVDMVWVLRCLNKLDVGIEEKVLLVNPEESSCIVASYRELKECIESAFRELIR